MAIARLKKADIAYEEAAAGRLNDDPAVIADKGKLPVLLVHGFASNRRANWLDTQWVSFLTRQGFRVVACDNRGHGESQKFYQPQDYELPLMAQDALHLMDYLGIPRAHIIGYSMGARIASAVAFYSPARVGKLVLGGNGYGMIAGVSGWEIVRDGLLADDLSQISDERARAFRKFADSTGSDREALAACVMGTRQLFSEAEFSSIAIPTLIAIGGKDDIAGSGEKLAGLMPNAQYLEIANRDHMRSVGDVIFKDGVLKFLNDQY